ncbi:methylmalonyl-CoA mutase family protein [Roseibium sp.]|uniref:methylmalonyl-CoA mutase family protein n=1 Tax=Roseibium sp. TaxID=1936156 RepID=UPI003A96D731
MQGTDVAGRIKGDVSNVPEIQTGTVSEELWLEQVDKALKGAARETLTRKTEDGALIAPLFKREAAARPRELRPARTAWHVSSRIDLETPGAAALQAVEDLQGGASGVSLVIANPLDPRGFGLPDATIDTLTSALDGVLLDIITLRLELGTASSTPPSQALQNLAAVARDKGYDPRALSVVLACDPVGDATLALQTGADTHESIAALLTEREAAGISWPVVCADGRIWHDQGTTQGQELGLAFASCLEMFRAFERAGLSQSDWAEAVSVTLVADADQQATIAKARAARMIFARILEVCGVPQSPLKLHMETSWRMLTRRDPAVNMLRNTVACFSAAVGGADSLTVLPHTQALGLPDRLARRLARNTQSILMEESHLAQVSDPAAGSGALESRTRACVDAAWKVLQAVEAKGGVPNAAETGMLSKLLSQTSDARRAKLGNLSLPLTGVSTFPNLTEAPVQVQAPAPEISDLPFSRLSAPFESLRDVADAGGGDAPHVFLAPLGRLAGFSARATFAANAFAAGGLRTSEADEAPDLKALVEAYTSSGAKLACLIGPDALYKEQGEEVLRALRDAGCTYLYMAGRPGAAETELRAAGLDTALYAGCDLLSLLQEAHIRLGVAAATEETAR